MKQNVLHQYLEDKVAEYSKEVKELTERYDGGQWDELYLSIAEENLEKYTRLLNVYLENNK